MTAEPASSATVRTSGGIFYRIGGIVLLAAFFGLSGYLLIGLTIDSGRLAAFWIANAVVVGVLLRRDPVFQAQAILACFAVNIAINLSFGDAPVQALTLALVNLLEISLSIFVLQKLLGREEQFDGLHGLGAVALVAVAVPIGTGIVSASIVALYGGEPTLSVFGQWLAAHCMPIAIFTPLVLIARDPYARPSRSDPHVFWRWGSVMLALAIVVPAIFYQKTYPFLFLAGPVVIFAAFLTGRLGTALTVAILACVASLATFLEYGPISLVKGGTREEIVALQTFLASCIAIGLPVATILSNRSELRDELESSRDFVASIIDGVSEIIYKVDGEWRWTYLNRRWAEAAGAAIETGLGRPAFTRVVEEDRPQLREWQRRIENGERPEAIVVRSRLARGEVRHIEIAIEPLFDGQGRFRGGIGTLDDVTESIEKSQALTESEARFRRLSEASPIGIFQSDATGQIVYVNQQWKALTGLADGEWEDGRWAAALHPADAARLRDEWRRPSTLDNGSDDEIRWVHKDGSISWAHVVFRPIRDAGGRVSGYVGVVSDITARVTAQAELARREEQLALLADNATDAVVRLTLDGTCIYASPSAREVFGIDSKLLVGSQLITGFHEEDNDRVQESFNRLSRGEIDRVQLAFRSRSLVEPDKFNWLEANCGLVRDPATGTPEEIIASLRNVNETKRLEAELVEAKNSAESAAEAKSAFLANMSREIRRPMNGVIGFTELALAGELEPEQRQNLEMIADSGRVMLRLLNDLLDLAKIDSGQMGIASERTDLPHKLRGAVRLMDPVASQKGLTLRLTIDDDVPEWIVTDSMRLRQIVLNLVGNALKFTERGSVEVKAELAGPEQLRVTVTDTGIGIAADRIAHVFDKFTQADETIARRFGGTGLGLPISADLARLLGGTLEVESEEGQGSTFTLTLPLERCAPPELVQVAEDPEDIRVEGARRILVAEDNPVNQRLTLAMLAKAGCAADLAGDGEQAVETVQRAAQAGAPYDLVLMDIQMPKLDGLGAARRLRDAGFDEEQLPIVALTANTFADDIQQCYDAGMQGHLAKPLRMRELVAALQRWVGTPKPEACEYEQETNPDLLRMYAERKQAALAAIDAALDEEGPTEPKQQEIAGLLHQIAGVAAYFGELDLGEASSRAERVLAATTTSGDAAALLRKLKQRLAA